MKYILLIKYIKSVLWRVAKCLSYIEEARCRKVNLCTEQSPKDVTRPDAVIIQYDLLRMSTVVLETCRGM